MPNIDRRTLLYGFGLAAVTPLLDWQPTIRRVAVAKPGENRFAYGSTQQAELTPCKLTSEDSAGALSIFELKALARSGPPRHVHRREDEWYYVLSGEYIFEVGGEKYNLPSGGSIWLPRDIPHVWANTATADGKLILVCQPGGFEKFFDELGGTPADRTSDARLKEVMAKYGIEALGPPLLGSSRQQH